MVWERLCKNIAYNLSFRKGGWRLGVSRKYNIIRYWKILVWIKKNFHVFSRPEGYKKVFWLHKDFSFVPYIAKFSNFIAYCWYSHSYPLLFYFLKVLFFSRFLYQWFSCLWFKARLDTSNWIMLIRFYVYIYSMEHIQLSYAGRLWSLARFWRIFSLMVCLS